MPLNFIDFEEIKMKTKGLYDILFQQLEKLSDRNIKGDELKTEIIRADAMSRIATQLINNGRLVLEAVRVSENSGLELPDYLDTETKPRKNLITSPSNQERSGSRRPLLRSAKDEE
jgi:hypothetical protein